MGIWPSPRANRLFLVPYNKSDLEPISKIRNGKFLKIHFRDQRLNVIFESLEIIDYDIVFEDLDCSEYLDKVFVISINGHKNIELFSNITLIEHVEKIEPPEELNNNSAMHYYPNDYIIPVSTTSQDSIPNDYLELIQAPCAWSITKGDSNINVGIAERDFNTVHEELINKFTAIIGTPPTSISNHGTMVSGLVGADTDNGLGTSSIGFNTGLVGSYARVIIQ